MPVGIIDKLEARLLRTDCVEPSPCVLFLVALFNVESEELRLRLGGKCLFEASSEAFPQTDSFEPTSRIIFLDFPVVLEGFRVVRLSELVPLVAVGEVF